MAKNISEIIDLSKEYKVIADGFNFTEGPIWSAAEQRLIFSDIPGNRMYSWSEKEGLCDFATFSFMANGNAFAMGGVVSCEHATSRVSFRELSGEGYRVLCDKYDGQEMNSPNDIVGKSDGSIYFTDPRFGRTSPRVAVLREREMDYEGVFRYKDGTLTLLTSEYETPNGLCFSADEKQMYVCYAALYSIWVYDVADDGGLVNGRLFAKTEGEGIGRPDGIKIDVKGNVYCCAQGGIHVFSKGGDFIGHIPFEGHVANFCFGGADMKTMFATAEDKVYALRCNIAGQDCGR